MQFSWPGCGDEVGSVSINLTRKVLGLGTMYSGRLPWFCSKVRMLNFNLEWLICIMYLFIGTLEIIFDHI